MHHLFNRVITMLEELDVNEQTDKAIQNLALDRQTAQSGVNALAEAAELLIINSPTNATPLARFQRIHKLLGVDKLNKVGRCYLPLRLLARDLDSFERN